MCRSLLRSSTVSLVALQEFEAVKLPEIIEDDRQGARRLSPGTQFGSRFARPQRRSFIAESVGLPPEIVTFLHDFEVLTPRWLPPIVNHCKHVRIT